VLCVLLCVLLCVTLGVVLGAVLSAAMYNASAAVTMKTSLSGYFRLMNAMAVDRRCFSSGVMGGKPKIALGKPLGNSVD